MSDKKFYKLYDVVIGSLITILYPAITVFYFKMKIDFYTGWNSTVQMLRIYLKSIATVIFWFHVFEENSCIEFEILPGVEK